MNDSNQPMSNSSGSNPFAMDDDPDMVAIR